MKRILFGLASIGLLIGLAQPTEAMYGSKRTSTSTAYGVVRNSVAPIHARCLLDSSTQDCLIPALGSKNLRVCLASDNLTYNELSGAAQGLSDISSQASTSGWNVSYQEDSYSSCAYDYSAGLYDVLVAASGNVCGGNSTDCGGTHAIDNCVCVQPNVGVALTESLTGSYHQLLGGNIYIDAPDISRGTGTAQYNVTAHGVAHDLAILMGIGAVAHSSSSANASDDDGSPNGVGTTLTTGELCQLTWYAAAGVTQYSMPYTCN